MSSMFGGLAICSLEALVGKDGREVIIEVNDCAMGLLRESQEEDRKHIAEVVLERKGKHQTQSQPPHPRTSKNGKGIMCRFQPRVTFAFTPQGGLLISAGGGGEQPGSARRWPGPAPSKRASCNGPQTAARHPWPAPPPPPAG